MKPADIIIRSGEWELENDGVLNLIKICCKLLCECHNISTLYHYYMLIKINSPLTNLYSTPNAVQSHLTQTSQDPAFY
jgi:hypothetical protein